MDVLTNPFAGSVTVSGSTLDTMTAPLPESQEALGVGTRPSTSPAIELDSYNLDRIMHRVRSAHSQAIAAKGKVDEDAKLDRRAYDLEDKPQAYAGQPNITLPLTRNKVDGMVGQLISAAFDAEPFASATPLTEDAVDVAPIWDAAMERELKLDGAMDAFKMSLREAAIVGTTFLGFSLAKMETGERAVQAHLTRLENFSCFPVEADDLSDATTFRRFTVPYFKVKEQAALGSYDMDTVRGISRYSGGVSMPLTKEAEDNFNQVNFFDEENRPVELLEVFLRYATEEPVTSFSQMQDEITPSALYHVVCTARDFKPLSVKLNPFREAFDMPPYCRISLAHRPGYLFGGSISKLLRAVQKIADGAMNDRLSYNKFALTPIIQGDSNNPIFRRLAQGGRLIPGTAIPTNGRPDVAGIQALQLPPPIVTIEDMDLAMKYADMGTHSDFQLTGQMPSKRMTAYETQQSRGAGELKLRISMMDFGDDVAKALKMFWALFDAYKVQPEGLIEIYQDGDTQFLSSEEIPQEMFSQELEGMVSEAEQNQDMELLQELMSKVQPNPETGELERIGDVRLVHGGIPSTRRGDLSWSLANMSTSADKAGMMQQLDAFAPYLQLLPQADMDTRIWEFLKLRLQAADIKAWKKLIGADPRKIQPPEEYGAMQQPFQENMASSSVR